MSTKMLVSVRLDQRLTMSQQLRQAITLLQYNTLDLKQLIQQHIETNPLLEVDEPEVESDFFSTDLKQGELTKYSADFNKTSQYYEGEDTLENHAVAKTFHDYLLEQTLLCQFNPAQQIIAEMLIHAIDENGYLVMSLEEIQQSAELSVTPSLDSIGDVLKTIQTFEPIGVGARDLRECLLIQLEFYNKKDAAWDCAYKIVSQFFDVISENNPRKIMKKLEITQKDYNDAMNIIRTLHPNPGAQYVSEDYLNIEPELFVKKIKNTWQVFLAGSILTSLKINKQYQDVIRNSRAHDSYAALKQELEEAKWLMKGLKRRNETLLNVATYIMEMQQDFLEQGHSAMRPMNIIDVSQALNVHESTVSRVTTGKFIITPHGVFELKYFFPSHVSTKNGDTRSATSVKSLIKDIIAQEVDGHIFSDNEIADILQKKGINIARRTVAKYREALNILSSYQRQMKACVAVIEETSEEV